MPHVLPDEVEAGVIPLRGVEVVTQPGAVKLTFRGRVLHTFAGPNMMDELHGLHAQLDDLLGSRKRVRSEVGIRRPWWMVWR